MAKKLLCWLGFHHWVRHVNDEGKPYRECVNCGKYREPPDDYLRDIGIGAMGDGGGG